MKRSEMIRLMCDATRIHDGDDMREPGFELRLVRTLLDAVEKAGMKPPEIIMWDEVRVLKDDFGGDYYAWYLEGVRVHAPPSMRDVHEWEQE